MRSPRCPGIARITTRDGCGRHGHYDRGIGMNNCRCTVVWASRGVAGHRRRSDGLASRGLLQKTVRADSRFSGDDFALGISSPKCSGMPFLRFPMRQKLLCYFNVSPKICAARLSFEIHQGNSRGKARLSCSIKRSGKLKSAP